MKIDIITYDKSDRKKIMGFKNYAESHSFRDPLLIFGIVSFFILGFGTADYLDLLQNTSDDKTIQSDMLGKGESILNINNQDHAFYENCLGYGNEKSIIVVCPDGNGHVYQTILFTPPQLADKFSNNVFSIRGISVGEMDGSMILKYQKESYATDYFTKYSKI